MKISIKAVLSVITLSPAVVIASVWTYNFDKVYSTKFYVNEVTASYECIIPSEEGLAICVNKKTSDVVSATLNQHTGLWSIDK